MSFLVSYGPSSSEEEEEEEGDAACGQLLTTPPDLQSSAAAVPAELETSTSREACMGPGIQNDSCVLETTTVEGDETVGVSGSGVGVARGEGGAAEGIFINDGGQTYGGRNHGGEKELASFSSVVDEDNFKLPGNDRSGVSEDGLRDKDPCLEDVDGYGGELGYHEDVGVGATEESGIAEESHLDGGGARDVEGINDSEEFEAGVGQVYSGAGGQSQGGVEEVYSEAGGQEEEGSKEMYSGTEGQSQWGVEEVYSEAGGQSEEGSKEVYSEAGGQSEEGSKEVYSEAGGQSEEGSKEVYSEAGGQSEEGLKEVYSEAGGQSEGVQRRCILKQGGSLRKVRRRRILKQGGSLRRVQRRRILKQGCSLKEVQIQKMVVNILRRCMGNNMTVLLRKCIVVVRIPKSCILMLGCSMGEVLDRGTPVSRGSMAARRIVLVKVGGTEEWHWHTLEGIVRWV